jgi:stage V sporulation protein B
MAAPDESKNETQVAVKQDAAQNAGRGGVLVLGAKLFFIVSGIAQQAILPAVIGLAGYGALSRVLSASNIVNNVMVAGSIQAVSRTLAERDTPARRRSVFQLHALVAMAAGVLFALAAPLIARFQKSPHIEAPLYAMAGVLGLYGVYAPLVGALNGKRQFGKQATLDIVFATMRTLGIAGLGLLGMRLLGNGPLGSALGILAAALCIVPLAARLLRRVPAGKRDARRNVGPRARSGRA